MLLVATLEEGIALREELPRASILVLSGFFPHQCEAYLKYRLTPMIHSLTHLSSLMGRKEIPEFHLKLDTGMHRLGITAEQFPEAVKMLGRVHGKPSGVATHLAESENVDSRFTDVQLEQFAMAVATLKDQRLLQTDARIHVPNTGAILNSKLGVANAVRPGLGVYGVSPNQEITSKGLIPVMEWKTRVACLKSVPGGESVGYGRTYVTKRREKIAILPVGYADGYPRLLGNRGHVLINGRRAAIRGRVSMDLIAVDVTQVPNVREGQAVTLLGTQGKQELQAWELALWAETIPYEIFCRISSRVPRVYVD